MTSSNKTPGATPIPQPGGDAQLLRELAKATMPFGKYKGLRLIDLPVAYLLWFRDAGFPSGRLGEFLALTLEIKSNGLGGLVRKLG